MASCSLQTGKLALTSSRLSVIKYCNRCWLPCGYAVGFIHSTASSSVQTEVVGCGYLSVSVRTGQEQVHIALLPVTRLNGSRTRCRPVPSRR